MQGRAAKGESWREWLGCPHPAHSPVYCTFMPVAKPSPFPNAWLGRVVGVRKGAACMSNLGFICIQEWLLHSAQ